MPRRILQGKVTSAKREKTITVEVARRVKHPVYGKIMTSSKKYSAHDEGNVCQEGQIVKIRECRPFSKTKTWEYISE